MIFIFCDIYIIYLTFKFNKGTNVKINVFSFKVKKHIIEYLFLEI